MSAQPTLHTVSALNTEVWDFPVHSSYSVGVLALLRVKNILKFGASGLLSVTVWVCWLYLE